VKIDNDELNEIARKFIEAREKYPTNSNELKKEEKIFFSKTKPIVDMIVGRYRKFTNYPDLHQDACQALIEATLSFKPGKGNFSWWAIKYMKTKVSRCANKHSTIKISMSAMKKKDIKPYKMLEVPIMTSDANPLKELEDFQMGAIVTEAMNGLPDDKRNVLELAYEFSGMKKSTAKIARELGMTRQACVRLLREAEREVRKSISEKL